MTLSAQPVRTSRRERKKEERRQRLYQAAVTLFRERGYDQVTVLDITERADLSKGTFFNYYESKSHVLLRYGRELAVDLLAHGRKLRGDSARDLFRRFFGRMGSVYRREGSFLDTLVRQMPSDQELQEAHRRGSEELMDLYRSFVERGISSGELRKDLDAGLVVELVRDVWLSSVRAWVSSQHGFSLETRVCQKLDLVFEGLCAR